MTCSRVSALSGTVVSSVIAPSIFRSTPAIVSSLMMSSGAVRAVDDWVSNAAKALDPRGERGARVHVDSGSAADPDAVRSTGQDHIAGPESDMARSKGDQFRHAEHHFRGGSGLHHFSVHDRLESEVVGGHSVG